MTKKLVTVMASMFTLASQSNSRRRSCAAAVVRMIDGIPVIIATGINGTPRGTDNTCEPDTLEYTYPHVVHAEDNCLRHYNQLGNKQPGDMLVVTDSPCFNCFNLLVESGIRDIVYARSYRIVDHMENAERHGITFHEIPVEDVLETIQESISRIHNVIC